MDLKFALRTLRKNPGFTLIAVLSLALGIGANAAMFSYVDAVLLRPLPVLEPSRIVEVGSQALGNPSPLPFAADQMSYPDYTDLRGQTRTLVALVCYNLTSMAVSVSPDAATHMTLGAMVSGNFFSGLGLEMTLGRGFRSDEDQASGRDLVAVISYALWERQLGSDPSAIGRALRINGSRFTIVGVAPRYLRGPETFVPSDVYVPIHSLPQASPSAPRDLLTGRETRFLYVLGRLRPESSLAASRAELAAAGARLAAQYPEADRNHTITVISHLRARFVHNPTDAVMALTLLAISGVVLLISCANVANLLLARASGRARELAIRVAIGAGRARLARQMLTESLLIAVLGGAAGLLVGDECIRFLDAIQLPSDIIQLPGLRIDMRLVAFSTALTLVTAAVFGLVPALRSSSVDPAAAMKSGDQGPARFSIWHNRFSGRNLLVTAQITLAVLLLTAAGLFTRSFLAIQHRNPGFRSDHRLVASFDPNLIGYNEETTRTFYRTLLDRAARLGGVTHVALGRSYPFGRGNFNPRPFLVDGHLLRPGEETPLVWANTVDENYLPLLETHLLRGRNFSSGDTAGSPRVAIINQTTARQFWPDRDALGQYFHLGASDAPVVEVIGIAEDGKYMSYLEPQLAALWTPFAQDFSSQMTLLLRTSGDPGALASALRAEVRALDPAMPIYDVRTLQSYYDFGAITVPRVIAQIVAAIGLVGLLLAVIGLYGVVAYSVNRRTREIGIRMAIGARPADVIRMVLRQGLVFTAAGLLVGIGFAFLLTRYLALFLVVSPHDPAIFTSAPAVLAAAVLFACWIPARRAAAVAPTDALRQE